MVDTLVDTAAITREWLRGPLTEIYKWGVLVSLVCHACDVFLLCLGHGGCYATDQASILCGRNVVALLVLAAIWWLLTQRLIDRAGVASLCHVVAMGHTVYAVGYLVGALREELNDGAAASADAALCEDASTGGPAPRRGVLGLFVLQQLHPLMRVCRNLVLSFLATAQPSSEVYESDARPDRPEDPPPL